METSKITIPMGLSLMLSEMINSLLYVEVKGKDGNISVVERDLPFGLKYSLVRNKAPLDRDVKSFNDKKMITLAKYGTPNVDTMTVELSDKENYEKYSQEIQAMLDTEITHSLIKLEPLDLMKITDSINISADALSILTGYLTNDPDLLDDIYRPIKFKMPEFKGKKKSSEQEVEKSKVDSSPKGNVKKTQLRKNTSTAKKKTTTTKTIK